MPTSSTANLNLQLPGGTIYDPRLGDIGALKAALIQIDSIVSGIQTTLASGPPQGPTGPTGPTGFAGPAGPTGLQGLQGNQGVQGVQGSDGIIGSVGPTGPQGIQGFNGAAGSVGPAGTQGIQGPVGTAGATGPAGPTIKEIPQTIQSVNYTCVVGDSGQHILHPAADTTARTYTIPTNAALAYALGTALTFVNQNGAGVVTIACGDTMRLAGAGTTGSRTLAANGIATAVKLTSTEWIISGTGLT